MSDRSRVRHSLPDGHFRDRGPCELHETVERRFEQPLDITVRTVIAAIIWTTGQVIIVKNVRLKRRLFS